MVSYISLLGRGTLIVCVYCVNIIEYLQNYTANTSIFIQNVVYLPPVS